MDPCKYKTDKCKECKFTNYRDCIIFRKSHNNTLVGCMFPFKYKKGHTMATKSNHVYTSIDKDYLKSVCADFAVSLNTKVRKINLNQTIDVVLNNEMFPESVIFIEILQKPYGEFEKVKNVFMSFIDKALLQNKYVFIFTTLKVLVSDEWTKV